MPNFDPTNKLQAAELLRKLRNSTPEDIENNFNSLEEYTGFYNKVKSDAGLADEELAPKEHPMLKPDAASLMPEDMSSFGTITKPVEEEPVPAPKRFGNLEGLYKSTRK
jgi:hypothetical protein